MTEMIRGTIHGKTIELHKNRGIGDGQKVRELYMYYQAPAPCTAGTATSGTTGC